ncbi:DUF7594 domain-containing protein [Bifidobacterium saguinibicoloris]|uniref:CBM96 family carbohydrate-binding protein n=1 Tax=Bifidobacterium saguinibicoloris TaxID=2834433 RepID=UPI001C59A9CC|nr:putative Ig domain-containing protein [Bifidobacterium saguinibicoloris]MBW3081620.1 FIVAR domain-containing protein [Bifidobacterium saguinibicoloris]
MTKGAPGRWRRAALAAIAAAAMSVTMTPFMASIAHADETPTDSGTVRTYAATGAGVNAKGDAATSPDVKSDKYTLKVNGTPVDVIKYDETGKESGAHWYDIARFESSSRTPVISVTVPNEEIDTYQIQPTRYYGQTAQISPDKHTLTFKMSKDANLNSVIVMINPDAEQSNKAGQPYLAIINDPVETKPDMTGSNVLNFQEFAKNYIAEHPVQEEQQERLTAENESNAKQGVPQSILDLPSKTLGNVDAQKQIIDAKLAPSEGKIVDPGANVFYPNQRRMSDDDATYALEAALKEIQDNPAKYNTLYFPAGTYIYGGLKIVDFDGSKLVGGKLHVYVDEGALLKNHVQPYAEAQEPAIGLWGSKDIEISGRGMFDANGIDNYNWRSTGDKHDAFMSQHTGGVMVVQSSDITFNDTYMRESKQWNWETHTAKDVTFNNIKGLTPYPLPWGDGTDLASGQNVTVNGVITLGNDDAFASGHYNPGRWFAPDKPDLYNKQHKFNTDSPDLQGYVNAAAGYDAVVKSLGGIDNDEWDTEDSDAISVNNTLNWTVGPGNGIRMGHETHGHAMKNYSFDNLNSLGVQTLGLSIQNHTDTYPQYDTITVKNSSFDTSRITKNFSIQGGQGNDQTVSAYDQQYNGYKKNPNGKYETDTYKRNPIGTLTLDNVWFNKDSVGNIDYVTNLNLNDIHINDKLVEYTNQFQLSTSNIANTVYTYTDKDGKTQNVRSNSLPTISEPQSDAITAKANNVLGFTVKATDPDEGDSVVLGVDKDTLPTDATFDPATGEFFWKPGSEQIGKKFAVTFTAADTGAQAGDYAPVSRTVTIAVQPSNAVLTPVEGSLAGDTWVGSWSGDQSVNYGTGRTIRVSGASGDIKRGYVTVDLSKIGDLGDNDTASLSLTYIGHRTGASGNGRIKVTKATTTADPATVTWKTQPALSDKDEDTASSAEFDLGDTVVPEGSEDNVKGTGIDGRKIAVDITSLVKAAKAAGETTLTLAVDNTGAGEVRFVSTEGATSDKLANATEDMAPVVEVTEVSPTSISGPEAQTITEGDAASSDVFTVAGADPLDITVDGQTADGKITWNDKTNRLDFAKGIAAGTYKVTVTLTDADKATASTDFTLTVAPAPVNKDGLNDEVKLSETLKQEGYTQKSWDAFQQALVKAQGVLTKTDATQDEVNAALKELKTAREGLQKNSTEPGTPDDGHGSDGADGSGTDAKRPSSGKGVNGLSKTGSAIELVAGAAVLLVLAGGVLLLNRRRG